MRLGLLCSSRWLLKARLRRSLPLPVRRKRFFAALWVFVFGIRTLSSSYLTGASIITMLRPSRLGIDSMVAELLELLGQAHEQLLPALRVHQLAAAEHDRHLHLVLVLQEAHHVALLGLVVVGVDLGPELDLLDVDRALVPARLLGLELELVAVLAEVHDPADRRVGLRGDLDQVEVLLGGVVEGHAQRLDAELLALLVDQAHLIGDDAVVDPDPGVGPAVSCLYPVA